MKDEIRRIMKLVQDGKLSPEDAAELIEAFTDAPSEDEETRTTTEEPAATKDDAQKKTNDPISALIDSIEKIGRDVSQKVNWSDVAGQVRQGVAKGVDAVKKAAEEAQKSGKFSIFIGNLAERKVQLPLAVPEGKSLRIEGSSGDVVVTGGHEVGSVVCTAHYRSLTQEEAKEKAAAYTPVLEESDASVLLRQPEDHDLSVDVEAKVARGVPVDVKTTSGDVRIEHTGASVRVTSHSGDVTVVDAEGVVEISLTSGDVRVRDIKADTVTAETKSGDVQLRKVAAGITLRTSNGDVTLDDVAPRSLTVETAMGDVTAVLSEPARGSMSLRTVNGDVTVRLLDGSDLKVNLSTLRGNVTSDVELVDAVTHKNRIQGRLGNGEGALDVSTVNGDVRLELRDATVAASAAKEDAAEGDEPNEA